MSFEDSIELMTSAQWEDRVTAEYVQVTTRWKRITDFIEAVEAGEKTYDGSLITLYQQRDSMRDYMMCLKLRMLEFGVEIPAIVW